MRPALGQCRAGMPSATYMQRSGLGLLGMQVPNSFNTVLTIPARHIRPFYTPTQKWNERKHFRPRISRIIPARHATVESSPSPVAEPIPPVVSTPYSNLTIGVVRETYPNERRVAITPQNAALLLKKGFKRVLVERSAGAEAQFPDQAYEKAGVTLGDSKSVFAESDILLKVRAPSIDDAMSEVDQLREGSIVISFLYPAQNRKVVESLATRGTTSFAMDMIPRISRAQVFDALSSMANIAGCVEVPHYPFRLFQISHVAKSCTQQHTNVSSVLSRIN
jgi:NAD(P) transhydrogenase